MKGQSSIMYVTKETEDALKSAMSDFINKRCKREYFDITCEPDSADVNDQEFRSKVQQLLGVDKSLAVHIFPMDRGFVSRPLNIRLYSDEVFITEC